MAIGNLWRNKLLTTATILVMGLILFIFNVIFMVNVLANQAIDSLESKVDMIFYLEDTADILVVNQLVQDLEALPETNIVTYLTKEEALQTLLEKYKESGEADPFETYGLDNPLPASIHLTTHEAADQETILSYLLQTHYDTVLMDIESNEENRQIVQNLIQITVFTRKLLLGIILTFLIGSTMIIANAIHITIFNRKKEINIMHLVGATPTFIRSPFLLEGAIYGLFASLIGVVLLMAFSNSLDLTEFTYLTLNINYLSLFITQSILSMLLGMASSSLATHFYLKHHARV